MFDSADLDRLNGPNRSERPSLLSKYEIPITHLEFDYVERCNDGGELEKILQILRSGEEGYYPDLTRTTEKRLEAVKPRSKLLRTRLPVLDRSQLDREELNAITDELNNWVNAMKESSRELDGRKDGRSIEDAPVRSGANKSVGETDNKVDNKRTKRIASTDYASWDKYDVDTEIMKMDLEEERLKKRAEEVAKSAAPAKRVSFARQFATHAEAVFEANREKEKGNEFFKAGDYEDALRHYDSSIEYAPCSKTYANRAVAKIKLKDYEGALRDCQKALKLEPRNFKAQLRKAQCLETLGRHEEALESVDEALRVDSNSRAAQELAKKLLKSTGRARRLQIEDVGSSSGASKLISKDEIGVTLIPIPGTSKMPPPFYKIVESRDPRVIIKERLKIQSASASSGLVYLLKIENSDEEEEEEDRRQGNAEPQKAICARIGEVRGVEKKAPLKKKGKMALDVTERDVKGGGEPCKEERPREYMVDDEEINAPYAFMTAWHAINRDGTFSEHAKILRKLNPERIHEVISNKLDGKMLSDILKCLYLHFTVVGEEQRILTILAKLAAAPRFAAVSLFMSETDLTHLRNLVQFLKQHGKALPEATIKLYGV